MNKPRNLVYLLTLILVICVSGCDKKTQDEAIPTTEDIIEAIPTTEIEDSSEADETPENIAAPEATDITLVSVIDLTEANQTDVAVELEEFYQRSDYTYYFPYVKSEYVECLFSDGQTLKISKALKSGKVTVSDLDAYGISYLSVPTGTDVTGIREIYKQLMASSSDDRLTNAYFEMMWNMNLKEDVTVENYELAFINDDEVPDLMVYAYYYGISTYLYTIEHNQIIPIRVGDKDDWMTVEDPMDSEISNGLDHGPGGSWQIRAYAYLPYACKFFLSYDEGYNSEEPWDWESMDHFYYYYDGASWTEIKDPDNDDIFTSVYDTNTDWVWFSY